MKYLKPINEIWGPVLKRDLLGEIREEDKFHSKEELQEYLKSEIKKQGENVVIKNLDVSLLDDLSFLFTGIVDGVKTLDLSGWKTPNVKDMRHMFNYCGNLISIDLSGWDTSNILDIGWMFDYCEKLESLDLSGWNVSGIKFMVGLFKGCSNIRSLDLSGWKTSNIEDTSWMFFRCENLKSLDLSGFVVSSVKNMGNMLCECPAPYEVVDHKIVKICGEQF